MYWGERWDPFSFSPRWAPIEDRLAISPASAVSAMTHIAAAYWAASATTGLACARAYCDAVAGPRDA